MARKNGAKPTEIPEFFCVYYMNAQKVYEMRMLLDNSVKTGSTSENQQSTSGDVGVTGEAEGTVPFLAKLKGEIQGEGHHEKQSKVVDTLEYVNTNSRMLSYIMKRCNVGPIDEIKEGTLVYVNDVSLELLNEDDVRTLLIIINGMFNGLTIPEAGSLDIGHMLQSFVKNGAAFKLRGTQEGSNIPILLKIPIDGEEMFEDEYTIDDLLIGKVGIVGIRKVETSADEVRSSLDFFNGGNDNKEVDDVIEGASTIQSEGEKEPTESERSRRGVYIDVIAIVQPVTLGAKAAR